MARRNAVHATQEQWRHWLYHGPRQIMTNEPNGVVVVAVVSIPIHVSQYGAHVEGMCRPREGHCECHGLVRWRQRNRHCSCSCSYLGSSHHQADACHLASVYLGFRSIWNTHFCLRLQAHLYPILVVTSLGRDVRPNSDISQRMSSPTPPSETRNYC